MIKTKTKEYKFKEILSNPDIKRIIQELNNFGKANAGEIIMKLGISPKMGVMNIVKLQNMGIIKNVKKSSMLELDYSKFDISAFEE